MSDRYVYRFELLDAKRAERDLTWYALAKRAGLDVVTLTPTRIRKNSLKTGKLLAVAEALGCDVRDFFEDTQPDFVPVETKPSTRGKKTAATSKATKHKRRRG